MIGRIPDLCRGMLALTSSARFPRMPPCADTWCSGSSSGPTTPSWRPATPTPASWCARAGSGTSTCPRTTTRPSWWRSLIAAIAEAGAGPVAALSVTGSHPGLVLLDGAGVVLRPVQAWDGARAELARLQQSLGSERWARRAGTVPDATTTITRLAWLRRTDPATFARIGTVLLPHDWLTFRLTGRPVTDRGSASCTGMWSPHTEAWLAEAIEILVGSAGIEAFAEHLPEIIEPDAAADWLDAPVVKPLGLHSRPVVASGTAEPMAIALALGLSRGKVGIALGEGTTVLAPLNEPIVDGSGVVHSRADATGGHLAVVHTRAARRWSTPWPSCSTCT